MSGDTKTTELSSVGWAPVAQASLTRWQFREPIYTSVRAGIVVRGYILLQWIFCKTFNALAHFMMGDLRAHLPILCWVFSNFQPKTGMSPCAPQSLFTPAPHGTFLFVCLFVSWDEKSAFKGKCFANVEEVKQKMAKALKRIKINEFNTVLSIGKNISIGVLHQMESILKVTSLIM